MQDNYYPNMKPSERIAEILGQETYNDKQLGRVIEAIVFYLDELHEQQKPCEHKSLETMEKVGYIYRQCKNCGTIISFD